MIIQCSRAGAIGDVIMTPPAIRQLRRENPQAYIRYVTESPDLLMNNTHVDEVSLVSGPSDRNIYFEYPLTQGYVAPSRLPHPGLQLFPPPSGVRLFFQRELLIKDLPPLFSDQYAFEF